MTSIIRNPLFAEFENLLASQQFQSPLLSKAVRFTTLNYHVDSEGDESIIEVEVPGTEPSDIKVKLEGRQLSVDTPKGNLFLSLGTRIDCSTATAAVKNGLLTIKVLKREAVTVEVKVLSE